MSPRPALAIDIGVPNQTFSPQPDGTPCVVCSLSHLLVLDDLGAAPRREPWLEQLPLRRGQKSVRPRQTIYRAGEALDGVPVICEGWAARVSRLLDGRRQILSFVLPGDLVSTNAVFQDRMSFFVEAITPVVYSSYDRVDLNQRLSAQPSLIKALVGACLAEKEAADQLVTNLGQRRAEERIARLFLHLKERLELRGLVHELSFALPLRQQHIADATGLTSVHVNRVLGTLRNNGVIELTDGTLRIADLQTLREIAEIM